MDFEIHFVNTRLIRRVLSIFSSLLSFFSISTVFSLSCFLQLSDSSLFRAIMLRSRELSVHTQNKVLCCLQCIRQPKSTDSPGNLFQLRIITVMLHIQNGLPSNPDKLIIDNTKSYTTWNAMGSNNHLVTLCIQIHSIQ